MEQGQKHATVFLLRSGFEKFILQSVSKRQSITVLLGTRSEHSVSRFFHKFVFLTLSTCCSGASSARAFLLAVLKLTRTFPSRFFRGIFAAHFPTYPFFHRLLDGDIPKYRFNGSSVRAFRSGGSSIKSWAPNFRNENVVCRFQAFDPFHRTYLNFGNGLKSLLGSSLSEIVFSKSL